MSEARVLVVDDDEVIRDLIAVNLRMEGFEVHTAVDGEDCLGKAEELDPDVITLDVMMPTLDGWDAAARLLAATPRCRARVVLITARAQEADRRRGNAIGVDAFLAKPFDPAELIQIVRNLAQQTQGSAGRP